MANYFSTINDGLNAHNIEIDAIDFQAKCGHIATGETKRFEHQGKQINIWRSDRSGNYEFTVYKVS